MEQQTSIPPKSRMKPWNLAKGKSAPFSHPWFGGGGEGGEGGLGFPFILPKIVGYVHEITLCRHHKVSKGGLRYGNKCLPLWYVNVVVATIFDFTTEEEMATSH